MSSEKEARLAIDALLAETGRQIARMDEVNIHFSRGVAVRELPVIRNDFARHVATIPYPYSMIGLARCS